MSTPTDDYLTILQRDCAGRLDAHPFFVDVPVLSRAKGDIVSDVEDALGTLNAKLGGDGKSGLVVSVLMPLVDSLGSETTDPMLEALITVLVMGSPSLNTIGISAEQGGLYAIAALNDLKLHPKIGRIAPDKRAMEPFPTGDDSVVGYMVYFRCKFGIKAPRKLFTPQITGTAAAVTIAIPVVGDADAEIYFTTDESFPSSRNSAATKYTAPFAVEAGTRVRAGAYKTDNTPSDIASATIGE